jgi:hypothetical protein
MKSEKFDLAGFRSLKRSAIQEQMLEISQRNANCKGTNTLRKTSLRLAAALLMNN